MSNPLTAIMDGLIVATRHWQLLLGILLILVISQFPMYSALRKIFGEQFTAEEYYSLSLAGWILPASLLALLWYALSRFISPQIGILVTIIIVVLAGLALVVRTPKSESKRSKSVIRSLLLLTGLFMILRLAFVSRAVLPLYFDSAQHYLWIRDILANATWPLTNYYHLGFHFLAACITFITQAQINDTMLILGQIILAIMPFSVFFIVRYWTQSNTAGIFAVILAAFGWYMPAHAVDWGKYPALASLALIPVVLSLACLSIQNRTILATRQFLGLNAILLTGIIVSIFLHSRALIVFGVLALTLAITSLWQKLPKIPQLLVFALSVLALIFEIRFIQMKGILGPLFDPYGPAGILISSVVLFLSIFAYRTYSPVVFACIFSIVLFVINLFAPVGSLIPGYANLTLLDRPFVEMILYLPLTILGGFGLAALEQTLWGKTIVWRNAQILLSQTISMFFIALVLVNAFFKYDLYPSDCCDIVSYDDLEAIDWIDRNLPMDVRILTSSTELNVLPTDEYQGSAGGDAGTWINPLIKRATIFMPFNTDFGQEQTLATICQLQVDYVYVGSTGWGFNDAGISVHPDRYKILFSIPKAKIYEVTGCE